MESARSMTYYTLTSTILFTTTPGPIQFGAHPTLAAAQAVAQEWYQKLADAFPSGHTQTHVHSCQQTITEHHPTGCTLHMRTIFITPTGPMATQWQLVGYEHAAPE